MARGHIRKALVQKRNLPPGHFSFELIVPMGRGADGKHKSKWYRFNGERPDAEARLAELLVQHNRGDFLEPRDITVGQVIDEFVELSKPPRRSAATYRTCKSVAARRLKPLLGHLRLQQLRRSDVEKCYDELRGRGLCERTLMLDHAVLSTAINGAVEDGLVISNVAQKAKNRPLGGRFPTSRATENFWSADEASRALESLRTDGNAQYLALIALGLDSGARNGELLGLQWGDLDRTTLTIRRQMVVVPKTEKNPHGIEFTQPKNRSNRQVALSEQTVTLLLAHKRQQAELKMRDRTHWMDSDLMFARQWEHQNTAELTLGEPLSTASINNRLNRLCKDEKIKRISAHGLRHTSATLLLAAGVPPNVVQRRLGHKDVSMTLRTYAHVLPTQQIDAAAKLAALLHR